MRLRAFLFRCCFRVACLSGVGAVQLGSALRALGRRSRGYGPIVAFAQLAVVLLWAAARAIFLLSSAPCYALARAGSARRLTGYAPPG
jgi:hypothetical protein